MRSLWLLFRLRLQRTWNARLLCAGMIFVIAYTFVNPGPIEQSVLCALYVAGLLSLQVFGQLSQLRRLPFAWVLPRDRASELWLLGLIGLSTVGLVTLWMESLPSQMPVLSACALGVLGFGMGMNPIASVAALAVAVFLRHPTVTLLSQEPGLIFATGLTLAALPIPFAGRSLGLWGRREYRGSSPQAEVRGGWRTFVAQRVLRHPAFTQTESGRDPTTLARALAYEDALLAGKGIVLRRWWAVPSLIVVCFAMWLPGGVLYDVGEYAFLVMISAAIGIYVTSKFTVIVPRRGQRYPVSRATLLRGCWSAHLMRMLGLWAMWSGTLWVFCTGLRVVHPDLLNGMSSYYPFVSTGFLVCLPMPLAQGFAVHYRGDVFQQYRVADLKLGRALFFLGSEVACLGACLLLVLDGLDWSPLRAVGTLLLVALAAESVLYWQLRRDLLRGDLT